MKDILPKLTLAFLFAASVTAAEIKKLDTAQIDELTGLKGRPQQQEHGTERQLGPALDRPVLFCHVPHGDRHGSSAHP